MLCMLLVLRFLILIVSILSMLRLCHDHTYRIMLYNIHGRLATASGESSPFLNSFNYTRYESEGSSSLGGIGPDLLSSNHSIINKLNESDNM